MRNAYHDGEGRLRNGWKVLGFFALLTASGYLLQPLLLFWPQAWRGGPPDRWFDSGVCLLVTWACLRLEDRSLTSLGLRPDRAFLREILLGTLGGGLLILAAAVVAWASGGLHWARTPGVGLQNLLAGAWFYLAVAWFEELLFRGYPFQRSVSGLGFLGAQAAFAAFFAYSHWNNPGMAGATRAWATLNIGLAALLLGLCWRRTGSLALPIGVHLGWNWTQGNLLGFGVSGTAGDGWWTPVFHGRPEWLTGGAFGLEASLPCTVLTSGAILALWAWRGSAPSGDASTASES